MKRKKPMKARKLRFTEQEENRIQLLADMYAGGNFSRYVRWATINCPPKDIKNANQ